MAVIRISCQVWPRAHERAGTPPLVTPPLSSCGARLCDLPALRNTPKMPLQPSPRTSNADRGQRPLAGMLVLNGSSVSSGISAIISNDMAWRERRHIYLFIKPLRAVKRGAMLRITDETGEISQLRRRATPFLLRSSGEFPHVGSLLNFPADKESSFIRTPSPL